MLILVFVLGLMILLYPTISNYINSFTQSRAIQTYNEQAHLDNLAHNQEILDQAKQYNQKLREKGSLSSLADEEMPTYLSTLNPNDDGIMGYIEIPKIDVNLTIAHTVEEDVLQRMVGHLPGTSLPIEGEGVHSILSAHRGLPSARLFTELAELEVGDAFTIHVLNRAWGYTVDDIKVILPEEVESLVIDRDKNYVTLMTCTPYGVNSHRLLVRGALQGEVIQEAETAEEAIQPIYIRYKQELIFGVAGVLLLLFIVLLIKQKGRR